MPEMTLLVYGYCYRIGLHLFMCFLKRFKLSGKVNGRFGEAGIRSILTVYRQNLNIRPKSVFGSISRQPHRHSCMQDAVFRVSC